jgi:hypothetical protein
LADSRDIFKPERLNLQGLSFDSVECVPESKRATENVWVLTVDNMIIPCKITTNMHDAQNYLMNADFLENQKKAIPVYAISLIYGEMVSKMAQEDERVQQFKAVVQDVGRKSANLVPSPYKESIAAKVKDSFRLITS